MFWKESVIESLDMTRDLCWYIEKEGENLLGDAMGDSLGELTDELGGEWITKWTATGPNYFSKENLQGKGIYFES